jgi:serine/threonine protein kinase/tetratricopeptide (TPR) repeat protein
MGLGQEDPHLLVDGADLGAAGDVPGLAEGADNDALVVDIEPDLEHGCLLKSLNLGDAGSAFQATRLPGAFFIVSTPRSIRSITPKHHVPRACPRLFCGDPQGDSSYDSRYPMADPQSTTTRGHHAMELPVTHFVEALLHSGVLDPAQKEQFLREDLGHSADLQALHEELLRRGWLTRFQLAALTSGHGEDLVRGRYLLLDCLGEGGMGRVYKARHRRMRRVVAMKFIRDDLLAEPSAVQRFYQEIEAAARLSHPNIVMAFEADEVGGTHFLVTEYIEGVDLRKLLATRGPLPATLACEAARQAALGLHHAHSRGVVHRDVKPANLLLSREGVVKILDLGVARLAWPGPDGPPTDRLTRTGELMGTPDYLAPEQIADPRRVDARTDIYGLGCTLYHLLAGAAPFAGRTLAAKLIAHRRGEPPDLAARRPDLPPGVSAVVRAMMAVRPEHRYESAAEVASALEPFSRPIHDVQHAAPVATPETRRIEGELDPSAPPQRQETFALWPRSSGPAAVPEPEPEPPALPTTPAYRPPTPRQARGLGKRRALLAAALVLAALGLSAWGLWPGREAEQGTRAAPPRGTSGRRVAGGGAARPDPTLAREYLDRARAHVAARDFARALAEAGEAIRLDPELAEAYTLRATTCNLAGRLPQAIADATEAIRLDPRSARAYTERALADNNTGQHDRAIADATEALRLEPRSSFAYTQRAWAYLMAKGDPDRAIADYTEALRLEPRAAWIYEHRARAYIKKGEPDRAIADCTEALRFDPKLAFALFERGEAYTRKGDPSRAMADADGAIRLEPQLAEAHRLRGDVWAKRGELDRAIASYTEAIRLDPRSTAAYRGRAEAHSRKGESVREAADRREAELLESPASR